jgi:4-diphosphocytidyl-2-C-methyl-D-erythritol kinase
MARLTLHAYAKINLDLAVLDRRPDGYHELRTVFQSIALHDTVEILPTRGRFSIDGDATRMPLDRTNLAWRAAEALWQRAGRRGVPSGTRIRIVKRIPAQAGLAGGSSDAAAALLGLNRLWNLKLPASMLLQLAGELGSDVPFFLVGGTALGLGRGERLYPLADLPLRHLVIVVPDFGVATPDAYRWLAEERAQATDRLPLRDGAPFTELLTSWRLINHLEPPVVARHPEIAEIRDALSAVGARAARMSGSGSAVFGLFDSAATARRAARALTAPGRQVFVSRTRPRSVQECRFLGIR